MPKPRRKEQIRLNAEQARGAMRQHVPPPPAPAHWTDRFLEALTQGASVSAAARMAGISRSAAYEARYRRAGFGRAWDEALLAGEYRRCRTVKAAERLHWRWMPVDAIQRHKGTIQR